MISDGVLASNAHGNVVPDTLHISKGFRKECVPATGLRDTPQYSRIAVQVGIVVNANGEDCGTRPLGHLENIIQTPPARVISAITQHDKSFLISRSGFQMLDSHGDRVV